MRADRLIAIVMLLQARGRITTKKLAEELEVSERTIYRDMVALSAAGVPVYGSSGPEGGYELVESYRTSLTGLTPGEVRALFMVSIPAPLDDLGLSNELKAALRKLSAALPEARRGDEEMVHQRIFLDTSWWDRGDESPPHLQTLYQAVWQNRQISLRYRPLPMIEIELTVDPFGLVAKAGAWYLVSYYNARIRVHRLTEIVEVRLLETTFERPADFNLREFWASWCRDQGRWRANYAVRVRVMPEFIPWLSRYFGDRIGERVAQAIPPDDEGRIIITLSFDSLEAARERLLSCGGGVEVLSPRALRASLQDYACQILERYKAPDQ